MIRAKHLDMLRPYLVGEEARPNGEWDMFCPFHEDEHRSASLNVQSAEWFCQACAMGGGVIELVGRCDEWVPRSGYVNGKTYRPAAPVVPLDEGSVAAWHSNLLSDEEALDWLIDRRGLTTDIIKQYQIGWEPNKRKYRIPIRDFDGSLLDARVYDPWPLPGRRKIFSHAAGYGGARLYPAEAFAREGDLHVVGGEWDALILQRHGFNGVTRTAGENTWRSGWGEHFIGRRVFVCHDCDDAGTAANRKVLELLKPFASEIYVVALPFDHGSKKDVTDYFNEGGTAEGYAELCDAAMYASPSPVATADPDLVTILDTFDASTVGEPARVMVTVQGRREPGYSVPKRAALRCNVDKGNLCKICPMAGWKGKHDHEVKPSDPVILNMVEATDKQVGDLVRQAAGVVKCDRLRLDVTEHQAVEILLGRSALDYSTQETTQRNIKITNVGKHDTQPNTTIIATGALYPDPRSHRNEFLAWEVDQVETSVDRFEITTDAVRLMSRFRPAAGVRPIKQLGRIANGLASSVTKIYGRPEMHAAIDLTFHSVLAFDFAGERVHRGWLELLLLGDTRTGKSEAVSRVMRHYGVGEMISCESASFAGLFGGLQQYGSSKEWEITWGVIPLNDQRLVCLDEASGLTPEEIAQLSDIRSSGVARMQKIKHGATMARTRLIWCANPRFGKVGDHPQGCLAVRQLVTTNEDIARFDYAMVLSQDDVPAETMNKRHDRGTVELPAEACHALVLWAWTRKPEQVLWADGAEDMVFKLALDLGTRYVDDPPLIQVANVRIKIARLAAALAARMFSTDASYENLVIKTEHVEDAAAFLDRIYGMRSMGYARWSSDRRADLKAAEERKEDIKTYLRPHPELRRFFQGNTTFRIHDMVAFLNMHRDNAGDIIGELYGARMLSREGADIKVQSSLHAILRELENE